MKWAEAIYSLPILQACLCLVSIDWSPSSARPSQAHDCDKLGQREWNYLFDEARVFNYLHVMKLIILIIYCFHKPRARSNCFGSFVKENPFSLRTRKGNAKSPRVMMRYMVQVWSKIFTSFISLSISGNIISDYGNYQDIIPIFELCISHSYTDYRTFVSYMLYPEIVYNAVNTGWWYIFKLITRSLEIIKQF